MNFLTLYQVYEVSFDFRQELATSFVEFWITKLIYACSAVLLPHM